MSESETVQRCCNAYYTVVAEEMQKEVMKRKLERARVAYLQHIPFLCGPDNIRAFIACIAHAMLLRIIQLDEGSKLLYAAQTARSALPREVRPVGRPRNSAYPHPEPADAQPQPVEKASAPQSGKNSPTPSPSRLASVQTDAPAGRSRACPDPAKAFIEPAGKEAISAPPPLPEKNTPTPSPAPPNIAPASENVPGNCQIRVDPAPSSPSPAPPAPALPANPSTRRVA